MMAREPVTWNCYDAEIVGADIPGILSQCAKTGISLSSVCQKDGLRVTVMVDHKNLDGLTAICRRKGASISCTRRRGLSHFTNSVWKRPVLLGSIGFLLFLTLWLPERVLFVSVDGYASVSPLEILNAAQQCGIRFGATRSLVRSEEVKNALLDKMPSLQWVGVNTKGCVAILSVREKQEEQKQQAKAVSSLVAIRDGIVITGTATAGELRCKPGQVVRSGEVLVSGYTDCGISVRAEKAKGEIFALTVRPLTVVAPLRYGQKGSSGVEIKKFSLIIGKKRINLSKDSGISYATCDKIREEYVLTLPGGFALPVTLVVDRYYSWDMTEVSAESPEGRLLSRNAAEAYLMESMIAGEILDVILKETFDESVYRLEGQFLCSEMIARERNEEIMEEYGKNSGENR